MRRRRPLGHEEQFVAVDVQKPVALILTRQLHCQRRVQHLARHHLAPDMLRIDRILRQMRPAPTQGIVMCDGADQRMPGKARQAGIGRIVKEQIEVRKAVAQMIGDKGSSMAPASRSVVTMASFTADTGFLFGWRSAGVTGKTGKRAAPAFSTEIVRCARETIRRNDFSDLARRTFNYFPSIWRWRGKRASLMRFSLGDSSWPRLRRSRFCSAPTSS